MKWSKGQTEVVTAVLIFGVVISLVGATYIWGVPLIKKQQAFGSAQRIESFMKDLVDKIERVDTGGIGARDVMTVTENGVLYIDSASNTIELKTFLSGTYYTISNESDPAWNPIEWGPQNQGIYGKDRPAIIRARAIAQGDGYEVTYQIKFRDLITSESQNIYLIKLQTDTTRNQNSAVTGELLNIENRGRTQPGSTTTYSNIKVTAAK